VVLPVRRTPRIVNDYAVESPRMYDLEKAKWERATKLQGGKTNNRIDIQMAVIYFVEGFFVGYGCLVGRISGVYRR